MTKICPPEKILNPNTNRCVLRRGLIGKKLLLALKIKTPEIDLKFIKKKNQLNNAFRKYIDPNIPDLHFSEIETFYISNPKDCKWRNNWLMKQNDIYHICDAFACIGGDTIQFMKLKPNAKIDAIQLIGGSKSLEERFKRLNLNIKLCSFLNSKVSTYATSIVDFIMDGKCKTVDYLYCDPPWADIHGNLYDCLSLAAGLNGSIITPLLLMNHYPKYICFKVPFNWKDFNIILTNLPNYHLKISGSFHWNGYWMHIIQRNKNKKNNNNNKNKSNI